MLSGNRPPLLLAMIAIMGFSAKGEAQFQLQGQTNQMQQLQAQYQQAQQMTMLQQMMMQFSQQGAGLLGSNPACSLNPPAKPLTEEDKEIADLKKEQADLKDEKRDDAKRLRELEDKKTKYDAAITQVMQSDWAQAVTDQLEKNQSCGCQRLSPDAAPGTQSHRRHNHSVSSRSDFQNRPRTPASTESDADQGANPYDRAWFNGSANNSGDVASGFCENADQLHASKAWKAVCIERGGVNRAVCHNHYFANPEVTGEGIRGCDQAIAGYHKNTAETDKIQGEINKDDDRIAAINDEIRDLKRQAKEDSKDSSGNSSGIATVQLAGAGCSPGMMNPMMQNMMNPYAMASQRNQGLLGYTPPNYQSSLYGGGYGSPSSNMSSGLRYPVNPSLGLSGNIFTGPSSSPYGNMYNAGQFGIAR